MALPAHFKKTCVAFLLLDPVKYGESSCVSSLSRRRYVIAEGGCVFTCSL